MPSIEEVIGRIKKACEKAGVRYAIIFGSFLRERKPYSDLDLAVKFGRGNALEKAARLGAELELELGLPVDVIPLELADLILRYEAFCGGKLVYCADEGEYWDDYVNSLSEYLDFKPVLERHFRRILREIRGA